ncbi:hypothetical protein FPRO03_13110 [Fusarium proliferatum]|nr:hypothetical protein FPRO03_13110 [Fusarium proliferatum]
MVFLSYAKPFLEGVGTFFNLLFGVLKFLWKITKLLFSKIRFSIQQLKRHFNAVRNGPENPKPLFKSSTPSTVLCCLLHLLPMLVTIALIALNLLGFFIGRELDGLGRDSVKLGVLQVAAKVHELFIIASLGAVIFHVVRNELARGEGLPLGLMGVGFSFSSVSFFFSPDFRAGVSFSHPRKMRIIALIVTAGLITPLVGPTSAVLMIPRELNWAAGGGYLWLNGTKNQLWPSKLEKGRSPEDGEVHCITGGWEDIRDNYKTWASDARQAVPSFEVPQGLGRKLYARTRQSDAFGEETWVFTAHNDVTIMQSHMYSIWSSALHYLAKKESGYLRLRKASARTARVESELPAVRVSCSPLTDNSFPHLSLFNFPVLAEYNHDTDHLHEGYQAVNATDVVKRKMKASPDSVPGSTGFRVLSAGLQLPPFPGQSASFGVIIFTRSTRGIGLGASQACSIDARWAKGKSFIHESRTSIQPVPIYYPRHLTIESEFEGDFSSTSFSPPNDGTWRRVNITTGWFDQLTPRQPPKKRPSDDDDDSGGGDSSTNQTTLESVLNTIIWDAPAENTRQTIWKVEFAIGLTLIDGMSRSCCDRDFDAIWKEFPANLWLGRDEDLMMESWEPIRSKAKELLKKGKLEDKPCPSDHSECTAVNMNVSITGYAMIAVGWFDYFCIVVLLIHVVIATGHIIVLVRWGKDSGAWESIPELVALAMNSEPPERVGEPELDNISAGIDTFGPRQKMGWVEAVDDNGTQGVTTGTQLQQTSGRQKLQLRLGNSRQTGQDKQISARAKEGEIVVRSITCMKTPARFAHDGPSVVARTTSHPRYLCQHLVPPGWIPPFVRIAGSAGKAIEEHDTAEPVTIRIYTDGNGINGHIVAAAITPELRIDGVSAKRLDIGAADTA